MADLLNQIKEMIQMLEIMDPRAAAELRGRMPAKPAREIPAPKQDVIEFIQDDIQDLEDIDEMLGMDNPYDIEFDTVAYINLDLTADGFASGIVYSELIAPPLAKRRGRQFRAR